MLLTLSILAAFLSAIILYFNARRYPSVIFLSLFFFLISLYTLYDYIFLYSHNAKLISAVIWLLPFLVAPFYIAGPILLLYMRSILNDYVHFKRSDYLHLLPAILFFLLSVPNLFNPGIERMEAATAIANNIGAINTYKPSLVAELLSIPVAFLTRPILLLAYAVWSLLILIRFLVKKKNNAVFQHQQFMIKWLFVLLFFLIILETSQVLLMVFSAKEGKPMFYSLQVIIVSSRIGLIGLLISPLLFPSVLYGLPRNPESENKNDNKPIEKPKTEEKKQNLTFNREYIAKVGRQIENCMLNEKPYLQHDCNITMLSKQIQIPAHHLAYYFREEQKQTFNDFRNKMRVDYAKKLIDEGKASEMTLEAIGFSSGFSSKSSFFTAFKKTVGTTPGVYLSSPGN